MQETQTGSLFVEGDTIEAVKGSTRVTGKLWNDCTGPVNVGDSRWSVEELQREGFTLTVIEKAAPKLPTEPGWYESAEYPISDGSYFPYRLASGQWKEDGRVRTLGDMTTLMPLTRVEPASVTAKKVLDAIRQRIGSIDSAYDFQAVAAEFGVTE